MIKNKLLYTLLALLLLVLALLPNGVSAGLCRKEGNDDYKCGGGDVKLKTVVDQPIANMWTETCDMNECCCQVENGWDSLATYQRSACADQQGTAIGCKACAGVLACQNLDNSKIGDYACTGDHACYGGYGANTNNLVVGRKACTGEYACVEANNLVVGSNSCRDGDYVCRYADNSIIGNDSCVGERACDVLVNSDIGNNSCVGERACDTHQATILVVGSNSCVGTWACYDAANLDADNIVIGNNSCNGEEACEETDNVIIGDNSCVKTGSSEAFGVCERTKDMVIGKESCRGDRGTCHNSVNSKIGDGSCQTKVGGEGEVENCYSLNGAEIGNDSCQDQFSCKYIGPRDASAVISNFAWKVGNGSCQDNISCYNAGRGDLYNALVEPQGVDIGDSSCNANEVCRDCEAGSVVPDGTCNDLNNVDEVGTLEGDYSDTTGTRKGDKRCRACFAELRQGGNNSLPPITAPPTTTKPSRQPSKKPNKKKPRSKNGKKSTKAKGKKKRKSEKTMDDSGDLFE